MNKTTMDDETKKLMAKWNTLRDEAKVKLHLAGMEAKAEWSKLQPEIDKITDGAHEVTEASRKTLLDGVRRLEKLLEGTKDDTQKSPPAKPSHP